MRRTYVSEDATTLSAQEFERVRVFLLRHDTRARATALFCTHMSTASSLQAIHNNTHLYASLNVTNPNSAVEYTTRSSARRLRCVIARLAHMRNSAMKSRSATPHRLFSANESKPKSFWRNSRSMAKGFPASAPQPRGRTEMRGMSCVRRSRSVLKAKPWKRRRCAQRMGCARYEIESPKKNTYVSHVDTLEIGAHTNVPANAYIQA